MEKISITETITGLGTITADKEAFRLIWEAMCEYSDKCYHNSHDTDRPMQLRNAWFAESVKASMIVQEISEKVLNQEA